MTPQKLLQEFDCLTEAEKDYFKRGMRTMKDFELPEEVTRPFDINELRQLTADNPGEDTVYYQELRTKTGHSKELYAYRSGV